MSMQQNDPLTDQQIYAIAEQSLKQYPFKSAPKLELICRSENATLKVTTDESCYALRVHRPNYHSKQVIESELLWLDALRDMGMIVPLPIQNTQQGYVNSVAVTDHPPRHTVLFEWMAGDMPTTDTDPASFEHLGEIMAKLHRQSIQWQRPDNFQRIVWDHPGMVGPMGHWGDWRDVPALKSEDLPIIEQTLADIGEKVAAYGQAKQRFGLIHADLRLTNLLMHESGTRIIDFDDCGLGWFMHDAAATVSFYEHYADLGLWLKNWLKGYQRIRPLEPADLEILPAMVMQRRIQLLAWVGSHQYTEMARSLGENWVAETLRLCQDYLNGRFLVIEAAD